MRAWALTFWMLPALSLAASYKADGGTSGKAASHMDLGIPSFADIPKGADLKKPSSTLPNDGPTVTAVSATYTVVHVIHAKALLRTASGAVAAGGALNEIALEGKPPSTEKFTTVVRVKCPQRAGAEIDVEILDPQGGTALSAHGSLSFRGIKGDEVDYVVDWDPTPCREGGNFQVLVRVGGQVLGTYPLKVGK